MNQLETCGFERCSRASLEMLVMLIEVDVWHLASLSSPAGIALRLTDANRSEGDSGCSLIITQSGHSELGVTFIMLFGAAEQFGLKKTLQVNFPGCSCESKFMWQGS